MSEKIITVEMVTSHGTLMIELWPDKAPKTVANFVTYVQDGFFDGTIFHRVVANFVIQGGGYTADYEQKETRDPIENEADNGMENKRGTLCMARTGDPHSATSQFFVNIDDNHFLDFKEKCHLNFQTSAINESSVAFQKGCKGKKLFRELPELVAQLWLTFCLATQCPAIALLIEQPCRFHLTGLV